MSTRRFSERGTSVLASLVFVAIFVIFIAGYKLAAPSSGVAQNAAVAAATSDSAKVCRTGEVHIVDHTAGVSVRTLKCLVADRGRMVPGPDAAEPACSGAREGACMVRYCPPSAFVTEQGTCVDFVACDAGQRGASCLQSSVQNASQAGQAASILATRLLEDRAETTVIHGGAQTALLSMLTDRARIAVAAEIDAAADEVGAEEFRDVAARIRGDLPTEMPDPAAHISCQPEIADPGMDVAIAFGCSNARTSIGEGFSTEGVLWGATQMPLDPSLKSGTMMYGLTCKDGDEEAVASCAVQVQKPVILLRVIQGETPAIGWVTSGVASCSIETPASPEVATSLAGDIFHTSGIRRFPALPHDLDVVLRCTTLGGVTRETRAEVQARR